MLGRTVVIILVALVAIFWWSRTAAAGALESQAQSALEGFWAAPAAFCSEAGLSAMTVVMSAARANGTRLGYISAHRSDGAPIDGQFFVSRPRAGLAVTVRRALGLDGAKQGWTRMRCKLEPSDADQFLFPQNVELVVNPARGRMRVHAKKKVWADMVKDAAASMAMSDA